MVFRRLNVPLTEQASPGKQLGRGDQGGLGICLVSDKVIRLLLQHEYFYR